MIFGLSVNLLLWQLILSLQWTDLGKESLNLQRNGDFRVWKAFFLTKERENLDAMRRNYSRRENAGEGGLEEKLAISNLP